MCIMKRNIFPFVFFLLTLLLSSIGNFCSLGGMLGNNSSGSRSIKYGSTIDNVKEITFIDGNGKKITLPKNKQVSKKIFQNIKIDNDNIPKTSKNSSGYQIKKITSEKNTHKIMIGLGL